MKVLSGYAEEIDDQILFYEPNKPAFVKMTT